MDKAWHFPIPMFQAQEHRESHRDQAHSIPKLNNSHAYLWEGREETHSKEYQWKLWGGRFMHPPVGKWMTVTGTESNLKCWRHSFNDQVQMSLWFNRKAWNSSLIPVKPDDSLLKFANTFAFYFWSKVKETLKYSSSKLSRVVVNRRFISICLSCTGRQLCNHPAVRHITMSPMHW